ncbi:hypothetical protein N8198_10685 [Gammaproteobacteria bacterium]|nr:hypothetical protein [Gammaproteobacteria bacterium]
MAKTKKQPKGLSKTEKSQVKQIAKSAVLTIAEKKYMNTSRITGIRPYRANTPGNIGVIAFSNSVSTVSDGTQLNYGIEDGTGAAEPIKELKMMRPYVAVTGDAQTDNYAIEGRECKPSSARVKWRMSRDIGNLISHPPASVPGPINPPQLSTNLPIIVRMIRVNPKVGQNNIRCDPEEDLFVTEYNNNIGINSANFDETELLMYRINKRRYNVVEDKFFRIQNALTLSYQLSWKGDSYYQQPQITNTNANCEKLYTTNHMLTSKKGGSLFYDAPDVSTLEAPSSGHKREYIFYHFVYAGAETFLSEDGGTPTYPSDLLLTASPMVKFTDV